jgi:hypothetical protein
MQFAGTVRKRTSKKSYPPINVLETSGYSAQHISSKNKSKTVIRVGKHVQNLVETSKNLPEEDISMTFALSPIYQPTKDDCVFTAKPETLEAFHILSVE